MRKPKKEMNDTYILNILRKLKYNNNFLDSLQSLSNKDYQAVVKYFNY